MYQKDDSEEQRLEEFIPFSKEHVLVHKIMVA